MSVGQRRLNVSEATPDVSATVEKRHQVSLVTSLVVSPQAAEVTDEGAERALRVAAWADWYHALKSHDLAS